VETCCEELLNEYEAFEIFLNDKYHVKTYPNCASSFEIIDTKEPTMSCKNLYFVYETDWLEITFSATAEQCDYGVARSPIWWEIDESSINMEEIRIFDEVFSERSFKERFGKEFALFLYNKTSEHLPSDIDEWTE
jgi:hypothetical protein